MKTKNTFFSFLRHFASTAGGVLLANPDPRFQALGAVLSAFGAGWGMQDEHAAENPGMKLPPGPPSAAMLILSFASFAIASFTSGCASGPATPAQLEARAYALVNTAGVLVAKDDPALAAEIERIAAGVDAVFEKGVLTPQQLAAFLAAINVPEDKRALLVIGLNNAYELYKAETGRDLIEVSNPTAAAILRGVKRGITDAIAITQALKPNPAAK